MFFRKKTTPQFSISIPEPCSENWNSMHVVDSVHRHCDSCAKNVVDFSQMSDDEVLLFFRNSTGNICGRFRKEQLERTYTPIPPVTRPALWWKAAALLPLTLLGKNSAAQSDSVAAPDSLQVMNDTLAPLPEIGTDSAVVVRDSLPASLDTTATDTLAHTSNPQKESNNPISLIDCISVQEYHMGVTWCPPIEAVPPFGDWFGWEDEVRKRAGDELVPTNPDLVMIPEEPKPDPIPPTLPEHPWYEAVLPRSWRIRKP